LDELSYADIVQQYQNNLVSYKGRHVYISRVFEDKRVKIFDLESRLTEVIPFQRHDFSVIKKRLGLVNIGDSVIYISRIPVRKMGIGINSNNVSISPLPVKYPQGRDEAIYAIRSLVHEGINNTLKGKYPSFQQALEQVCAEKPSTVAFDRQFAVTSELSIYYKTKFVGIVSKDAKSASDIMFADQYKHLSILLENNHEKTVGYSCP